ncbi:hypothetical protein ACK8P5_26605 (plasmid) [Paenibacillus sp. EC2-1]|uniref:hypothetical protein n=1 Tax=Paenibacillus sp. EC2-1 TaxID=3388665 RepID=UPI003BEF4A94
MLSLYKKYGVKKYLIYRRYYRKKLKGKVTDSYIDISQLYYPEDVGTIETRTMKSGKTGRYEIIKVVGIDDFGSESIHKDFIGYNDTKPIRECTLKEFIELYDGFLKVK